MSSFYRVYITLKHNYCWTALTELFKDYNLQIDIVGTKICINTKQLEKIMLIKANNRSAVFSFLKEF
jgi:predicted DNA binding protein